MNKLVPTKFTSHASLKCSGRLFSPSTKFETRKKNANNPARQVHRPLGRILKEERTIKPALLVNFYDLIFIFSVLLDLYILISTQAWLAGFILIMVTTGFLGCGIGNLNFYFQLTSKALVIRNRYWMWIKKEYPLDEIQSVRAERPWRAKALIVESKNGTKGKYHCYFISSRKIDQLLDALRAKGIDTKFKL